MPLKGDVMNQNSNSYPPILAPSSELGALLFAALPCIREAYRPLASFAFHMTELSRLKNISAMPPLSGFNNIDSLIADKETLFRSLSFYGNLFHMPLLSTIANLLQAMQFYNAYKDILPGLFSATGGNGSPADSMAGLFSGMGGLSPELFSSLGGLSPELLSSLLSGFSPSPGGNSFSASSGGTATPASAAASSGSAQENASGTPSGDSSTAEKGPSSAPDSRNESPASPGDAVQASGDNTPGSGDASYDLYDSLYSLLTPEQKEIYEQLMHTD